MLSYDGAWLLPVPYFRRVATSRSANGVSPT